MWPCRRDVRRQVICWGRLFLASFFLHICALFVLFIVYRGQYGGHQVLVVALNKKMQGHLVLLPLCKRAAGRLPGKQLSGLASSKAVKHSAALKKTTLIGQGQSKKTQEKQVKNKQHEKKIQKMAKKKKNNRTQDTLKKQATIKKEQHKEPEKKAEVADSKVPDKKSAAVEKKEVPRTMQQQDHSKEHEQEQKIVHTDIQENVQEVVPESVYIGQAELDFLHMHEQIQRILEEQWRPPVGLPRDTTCHIRVMVDWQGKACSIKVEKSSGIAMYDISARATLATMEFPVSARGKEIVIHFST